LVEARAGAPLAPGLYSSWRAHRSKKVPAMSRVDPSDEPSDPVAPERRRRRLKPAKTLDAFGSAAGWSRKRRIATTSVDGMEATPFKPGAAASSGDAAIIPRAAPTT